MSDDIGIELPDKLFFRIGETAQLVGVEPHVLRYWESEFKLRPSRSESGQRMYRRRDISSFLKIRQLLHNDGFTIAGARKALEHDDTESPQPRAASTHVKEALDRIERLRTRIAEARTRFAGPESTG